MMEEGSRALEPDLKGQRGMVLEELILEYYFSEYKAYIIALVFTIDGDGLPIPLA